MKKLVSCGIATLFLLASCSSDSVSTEPTTTATVQSTTLSPPEQLNSTATTFTAQVWADNWFALYVNGELVGEDSVSITTERSFNAETITFNATYPFTISMVAKDFKENDTGLEYIGTDRQQMGDGGVIAQITDAATGKVVAVTSEAWKGLAVHQAPLDKACENSAKPETDCTSKITPEPDDWMSPSFDDSAWNDATLYDADAVRPKDGYDDINWDPTAKFIWTSDLEIDNTILWRLTVTGQ